MHNKISKSKSFQALIVSFDELLITGYLSIMALVFPLYMPHGYVDLGEQKYLFFLGMTLIFLCIMIPCRLFRWLFSKKTRTGGKSNSILDWCMVAYLVLTTISFFGSKYLEDAFVGYPLWWTGWVSQVLLVALYFVVSRNEIRGTIVLYAFSLGCFFTYLIAYLNRFDLDVLGVYVGREVSLENRILFVGTIGQATWYSGFIAVTLPLLIGIFIFIQLNKYQKIALGAVIFLGSASAVNQNSDSIYVALGVVALILLSGFYWMEQKQLENVILALLLLVAAWKLTGVLQLLIPCQSTTALDSLSIFCSQSIFTWIGFAVLLVAWLIREKWLGLFVQRRAVLMGDVALKRKVTTALCVMMFLGILLLIVILGANGYLRFDETWGNSRGWIWKFMIKVWGEMPIQNKLVGVGPNSIGFYVNQYYGPELRHYWGDITLANAHNEWLTMMLDEGILGGFVYITLFVVGIRIGMKTSKKNQWGFILACCVVSYVMHNIFCYQQMMVTPYVFVFLGMLGRIEKSDNFCTI